MPMIGSSAVIDGLQIKADHKRRLIACNYKGTDIHDSSILINDADLEFAEAPATSTTKTILIDGQEWGINDGAPYHRLNLTIKNCICRHAETFRRFPLRKYKGQWTLENIKLIYDAIPTASDHICLGGYFNVYDDVKETVALKDITIIGPNTFTKSAIHLVNVSSGMVGTRVHLSNIRSNCVNYEILTENVCWDEYVDATVKRNAYSQFGAVQKGFMVKDYSANVKYVWSGTAWVALTV